jgi:hypothetical protein
MKSSATEKAVDAVESILNISRQSHFADIERLCTDALSVYHDQEMDAQLRGEADEQLQESMKAASLNALEINHCTRFGIDVEYMEKGRKKIKDLIKLGTLSSRDYETVTDLDILRSPIVDICITQKNEPPPEGFYRISLTPSQKTANIKSGTNGKTMYLCVKKDKNEIPVTALVIILPDRNEHVPPGFSVVKKDGRACSLNTGTGGERMFLCFKRDAQCNPLTDLQVFFPTKGEIMPVSFNLLDRSVRSVGLDLNLGAGGHKIALSYKQSLVNLECLRISFRRDDAGRQAASRGRTSSGVTRMGNGGGGGGSKDWGAEALQALAANSPPPGTGGREDPPPLPPSLEETDASVAPAILSPMTASDVKSYEHSRGMGSNEGLPFEEAEGGIDDDNASVPSLASDGEENISETNEDMQAFLALGGSCAQEAVVTVDDRLAPLSIRRCLHPILACLFVRQGNLFNIAVDSIELLLTQTDFFTDDFKPRVSSASKTAIDLVIECLCERFDIYHENTNEQVLKLLKLIIETSRGNITRHSIKKIFRASVFICSCYSAEKHWLGLSSSSPVGPAGEELLSFDVLRALVQAVCEAAECAPLCVQLPALPPPSLSLSPSPGGGGSNNSLTALRSRSPVAADVIASAASTVSDGTSHDYISGLLSGTVSENQFLVHDIVMSLVGEIVDTIELSRISESALQAVSKKAYTTASPKFWVAVETCSRALFAALPLRNAYVLLAGLCKVSCLGLGGFQPGAENGDTPLRYLGNKLFALDAIREFCRRCRYKMKLSKLVGYQIRRLVVPIILANMEHALVEPRIFLKLMKLMTVLWRDWREHVRVEFSVLCEQVVLRALTASPHKLDTVYGMIALKEIFKWFEQPHLSLEMYVNFDMHSKFVADWNIFSHLSRAVCALAVHCSKAPAAADTATIRNIVNSQGSHMNSMDQGPLASTQNYSTIGLTSTLFGKGACPITYHDVRVKALEVAVRITRSIMDASGHANMIQQRDMAKCMLTPAQLLKTGIAGAAGAGTGAGGEVPPRVAAAAAAGWVEREIASFGDDKEGGGSGQDTGTAAGAAAVSVSSFSSDTPASSEAKPSSGSTALAARDSAPVSFGRSHRATSIRLTKSVNLQSNDVLSQAVKIYREKDSMTKAVKFLVAQNFMSNTPQEYASFVRLYKKHFDPAAIGDFLGEGGRTPEEEHFWDQTRFRFTRAISFVEMDVETALRLYFTACGFRLPGEAQKIDRFVTAFVRVYWEDNMSTSFCPFRQQDTVHLLAYAVIMLNTDLHRVSAGSDSNRRGSSRIVKMTKDQYIKNLRGVDVDSLTGQKYDIDPDELSKIYDNVAARPIEMVVPASAAAKPPAGPPGAPSTDPNGAVESCVSGPVNPEAQRRFSNDMRRGMRGAGELLRDLSNMKQRFFVIGVDTSISTELVQFMFEAVWHDFHDVTDSLLTKICSEEDVLFSALEILANALSVCIFLDMKVERLAFATQLVNFKTAVERIESDWHKAAPGAGGTPSSPAPPPTRKRLEAIREAEGEGAGSNQWFAAIEAVTPETVMTAIKELHYVITRLKDTIQICARHEATKTIMGKIEKRANIYDPNRFIIKDGDLNKRCRNAKMVNYHFFLFSDMLIYAHLGFSEYKVHIQLPLEDMNVALVDPADDPEDRSFFIEHPVKSFAVEAASTAEKLVWMREMSAAVDACIKRRNRTPSMFDRFQEQGEKVTEIQQLHHDLLASPAATANGNPLNIFKRLSKSFAGAQVQIPPPEKAADGSLVTTSKTPLSPLSGGDAVIEQPANGATNISDIKMEFNAV